MAHVAVVTVLSALIITLFSRQVSVQLRSGKVRPRGARVDKTRKANPVWYWSSIGVEIATILVTLYWFLRAVLRANY